MKDHRSQSNNERIRTPQKFSPSQKGFYSNLLQYIQADQPQKNLNSNNNSIIIDKQNISSQNEKNKEIEERASDRSLRISLDRLSLSPISSNIAMRVDPMSKNRFLEQSYRLNSELTPDQRANINLSKKRIYAEFQQEEENIRSQFVKAYYDNIYDVRRSFLNQKDHSASISNKGADQSFHNGVSPPISDDVINYDQFSNNRYLMEKDKMKSLIGIYQMAPVQVEGYLNQKFSNKRKNIDSFIERNYKPSENPIKRSQSSKQQKLPAQSPLKKTIQPSISPELTREQINLPKIIKNSTIDYKENQEKDQKVQDTQLDKNSSSNKKIQTQIQQQKDSLKNSIDKKKQTTQSQEIKQPKEQKKQATIDDLKDQKGPEEKTQLRDSIVQQKKQIQQQQTIQIPVKQVQVIVEPLKSILLLLQINYDFFINEVQLALSSKATNIIIPEQQLIQINLKFSLLGKDQALDKFELKEFVKSVDGENDYYKGKISNQEKVAFSLYEIPISSLNSKQSDTKDYLFKRISMNNMFKRRIESEKIDVSDSPVLIERGLTMKRKKEKLILMMEYDENKSLQDIVKYKRDQMQQWSNLELSFIFSQILKVTRDCNKEKFFLISHKMEQYRYVIESKKIKLQESQRLSPFIPGVQLQNLSYLRSVNSPPEMTLQNETVKAEFDISKCGWNWQNIEKFELGIFLLKIRNHMIQNENSGVISRLNFLQTSLERDVFDEIIFQLTLQDEAERQKVEYDQLIQLLNFDRSSTAQIDFNVEQNTQKISKKYQEFRQLSLIAGVYYSFHEYAKAYELLEKTLDFALQNFGINSIDYNDIIFKMACNRKNLNQPDQSLNLCRQYQKNIIGLKEQTTLAKKVGNTIIQLASLYLKSKDVQHSIKLYEDYFDYCKEIQMKSADILYLSTLMKLGIIYLAQGNLEKGKNLVEASYQGTKEFQKPEVYKQFKIYQIKQYFASCLQKWGETKQSLEVQKESLQLLLAIGNSEDQEVSLKINAQIENIEAQLKLL